MKLGTNKQLLIAFCFLFLFSFSCKDMYKSEDPGDVRAEDIIDLTNETVGTIRADGVSNIILIAKIPEDSANRTIKFSTDLGTFIGTFSANTIDVTADAYGIARAKLKVGTIAKNGLVIASISGYKDSVGIKLDRAHADKITAETSTLFVTKSGSVRALLRAFLSRKNGAVSIGTKVDFYATQLSEQNVPFPVGRFLGIEGTRTNEKGIATVTFAADTKNVIVGKPVRIEMKTERDNGSQLTYHLSLNVRLE